MKKNHGFTLIELLIVIAVLSILAGIVYVALDPGARMEDSRNTRRWTDVNTILSAIKLHQVDNGGAYLDAIEDLPADLYYQIGNGASCNDDCLNPTVILSTDCVDLTDLVDAGKLPAVPVDPNADGASASETRYYLLKESNGVVTIGSCAEELGTNASMPSIFVQR